MGSFTSASPLLEHARRSLGLPSQTNGTELWALGAADHNCQRSEAWPPDLLPGWGCDRMWLFPARGSVTRSCRQTRRHADTTVCRCLHRAWLAQGRAGHP